jgi:hypothetical protein
MWSSVTDVPMTRGSERCCEELEGVMEERVLFRIHKNLPLPEIAGIGRTIEKEATALCRVRSKGGVMSIL